MHMYISWSATKSSKIYENFVLFYAKVMESQSYFTNVGSNGPLVRCSIFPGIYSDGLSLGLLMVDFPVIGSITIWP